MMEKIILLLCLINAGGLIISTVFATDTNTYPEEVHQLVLERISELHGDSSDRQRGSWSSWSTWTPCSRSCGTGVSIQHRECHSKGRGPNSEGEGSPLPPSHCIGRYKRYQVCNTQICPQGLVDFRSEQCSAFNRTPFNKRFYSWEPFIDGVHLCTLNCRAVGMSFYATLNQSVVDGTTCGELHSQRTNKICVEGNCMEVGCDGLLGSGRVVDACGVCGGDNATCRLISGVYSRSNLPFGYNLIATLPPGATNLSIFHLKPSANYLAMRELGGNYILNGPWGLNRTGNFQASGTVFTYTRPHAQGGDHLFGRGPTTHSLDVMLFYQDTNPGIKYEYRLPLSSIQRLKTQGKHGIQSRTKPAVVIQEIPSTQSSHSVLPVAAHSKRRRVLFLENRRTSWSSKDLGSSREKKPKRKRTGRKGSQSGARRRYQWTPNGYTACSRSCGGGTQSTNIVCVKRKRKDVLVPPQFCGGLPQPSQTIILRCNVKPCPPHWEATDWSECSVTCGLGVQVRKLVCKQRTSSHLSETLEEDDCRDVPTIPTAQVCQLRECDGPPTWVVGSWSDCSSQCGLGTRRRNVQCTAAHGPVEEELCKQERPIGEEMCDMGSCASDTWFFSAWDESCHGPCGEGTQKRRVHCSGDALQGKESSSCPKELKPQNSRDCNNEDVCGGSWFVGPWSDCDAWCGTGQQRRAIVCVNWHRGQYRVTKSEAACKLAGEKPLTSRPCAIECRAEWFTSEWSECSVSCDGGIQRREVKCLDHFLQPSIECSSAAKPDSRQACNSRSCLISEQEDRTENEVLEPTSRDRNATSRRGSETLIADKTYEYQEQRKPSFISKGEYSAQSPPTHFEPFEVSGRKGGAAAVDAYEVETRNHESYTDNMEQHTNSVDIGEDGKSPSSHSKLPVISPGRPVKPDSCIDRMKNCNLVFRARLCKLKYYNKLCCNTCSGA